MTEEALKSHAKFAVWKSLQQKGIQANCMKACVPYYREEKKRWEINVEVILPNVVAVYKVHVYPAACVVLED